MPCDRYSVHEKTYPWTLILTGTVCTGSYTVHGKISLTKFLLYYSTITFCWVPILYSKHPFYFFILTVPSSRLNRTGPWGNPQCPASGSTRAVSGGSTRWLHNQPSKFRLRSSKNLPLTCIIFKKYSFNRLKFPQKTCGGLLAHMLSEIFQIVQSIRCMSKKLIHPRIRFIFMLLNLHSYLLAIERETTQRRFCRKCGVVTANMNNVLHKMLFIYLQV